MIVIVLIILAIIAGLWIFFNPNFEVAPLSYDDSQWLIVWYNRPYIEDNRIEKERKWLPLIRVQ